MQSGRPIRRSDFVLRVTSHLRMSNPRGAYSDRGAYRGGRGGGRGRGRGGALVNFQAVAMDYDSAPVPKPGLSAVAARAPC